MVKGGPGGRAGSGQGVLQHAEEAAAHALGGPAPRGAQHLQAPAAETGRFLEGQGSQRPVPGQEEALGGREPPALETPRREVVGDLGVALWERALEDPRRPAVESGPDGRMQGGVAGVPDEGVGEPQPPRLFRDLGHHPRRAGLPDEVGEETRLGPREAFQSLGVELPTQHRGQGEQPTAGRREPRDARGDDPVDRGAAVEAPAVVHSTLLLREA